MAVKKISEMAYLGPVNNGPNQAARSALFSVVGIDLRVELVRGGELVLVSDGSGTSHMHALPFSKAESPFFCHPPISAPGGEERFRLFGPRFRLNRPLSRLDIDTWAIRRRAPTLILKTPLCVHLNLVDTAPTHPTKAVII